MSVRRVEIKRGDDWVQERVIDDAGNEWIERGDLAQNGKIINRRRITEPARPGETPPPAVAERQIQRVPTGPIFAFGAQAEGMFLKAAAVCGTCAGLSAGIIYLIERQVF